MTKPMKQTESEQATPRHVRIYPTSCDLHAETYHTACAEVSNSYDTMLATNKRLREALKPFANQKIEHFEQGHAEIPDKCPACGPILRARAALKEAE